MVVAALDFEVRIPYTSLRKAISHVRTMDIGLLETHATSATTLLKIFANENRLRVICFLFDGEKNVGDVAEAVDLGRSSVSQHLAILRAAHLVKSRRDAQTILYALDDRRIEKLLLALLSYIRSRE